MSLFAERKGYNNQQATLVPRSGAILFKTEIARAIVYADRALVFASRYVMPGIQNLNVLSFIRFNLYCHDQVAAELVSVSIMSIMHRQCMPIHIGHRAAMHTQKLCSPLCVTANQSTKVNSTSRQRRFPFSLLLLCRAGGRERRCVWFTASGVEYWEQMLTYPLNCECWRRCWQRLSASSSATSSACSCCQRAWRERSPMS